MEGQESLFEVIEAEEFQAATRPKTPRGKRQAKTEPRINTTWFALTTHTGFCTVPGHEELIRSLKPDQQAYRQKYPVRQVYEIKPGVFSCRDCFLAEADKT